VSADTFTPPLIVETPEDMMHRRADFLLWVNDAPTTQFINTEGTILELTAPRRGNKAYAKRQRKRYQRNLERLGEQRYSALHNTNGRTETAETQDLFFTFTYDHKKYTIDEANARVSNDLKKMRTYIHRIFDSKFGTITCYESSKTGYPAPHMIIRFDKSFPVFYHLSSKMKWSWRLKDKNLKLRFQVAWRSIGGGHSDVKGIVDTDGDDIGAKIRYAFKYILKAVVGDKKSQDSVTALNTLANNKAFHRGTVYMSPAFVNRTPNPVISRLDITRTKLQQAKNLIYTLNRKIKAKPDQETALGSRLSYLRRVISVLQSNLPPPEWKYYHTVEPWMMRLRGKGTADATVTVYSGVPAI